MAQLKQWPKSRIEQELEGSWLHKKCKDEVLSFLQRRGILSLQEVDDALIFSFRASMRCYKDKGKYLVHAASLAYARSWFYKEEAKALEEEAAGLFMAQSKKDKIFPYLAYAGVSSIDAITLEIRERFEAYLKGCDYTLAHDMMRALDRIKLFAIKKKAECGWPAVMPPYKEERVFLQYWPCVENAEVLCGVWDKEKLLFDFTIEGGDLIKRQVHAYLRSIMKTPVLRTTLVEVIIDPLRILYLTAMKEEWEDLLWIAKEDEKTFRDEVIRRHGTDVLQRYKILHKIRKFLFLSSETIRWDASVWFLDRMHLPAWKYNPAISMGTLSFTVFKTDAARTLQQGYARYLLGATDLSIDTVRRRVYDTRDLLVYCEKEGLDPISMGGDGLGRYIHRLDRESSFSSNRFNIIIFHLKGFYEYLLVHEKIKDMPLDFSLYCKKDRPTHHDRSVPDDVRTKTLRNLKYFPEDARLIYLHLWATGLRIGEVCSIKAGDYYEKDGTPWIRIYQSKMRTEKTIPIPSVLYGLMRDYIQRMNRGPSDYVFQNAKGKAFAYGSFYRVMRKTCEELGINDDEYTFRSHDFRHTMASYLYDEGMGLAAIRDFLGHKDTDMTKQYIDYIPAIIRKKNEEYFAQNKLTKEAGHERKD